MMAFAAYRVPGQNKVTFVKGKANRHAPSAEQNSGFYINVFSTHEVFYISPEEVGQIDSFADYPGLEKNLYLRPANAVRENALDDYKNTLSEAIAAVETGVYQKLVIARNHKLRLEHIHYAAILDQLAEAFPECLVYVFSTPHTGAWMGATPEKLLVKKQGHTFQTMALAGTIKSAGPVDMDQWSPKEKTEQQLVEQYIEEILKNGQYTFSMSEVFVLKTGLLNHLCTGFEVEISGREQMMQLAGRLHPTPAVGGLPAREGVHFLKSREKFLRECYTGYLGPVGILEQDLLYVNLRCCQLVDDGAVFYAGGGINKGSVIEKEMLEVENKLHNLERFFK
jgi:isochorismate synthase